MLGKSSGRYPGAAFREGRRSDGIENPESAAAREIPV